ncbi:hypothetical protein HD554DRAFT_2174632 [Boletus coccyginus]|nr:hypothetical protein HD554DRAFT_2174632 [Boletus coccyginus]
MSSDDDTIVHDDIFCPSYDRLLSAADTLSDAEDLALRYRQYKSSVERNWFYDSKDAALQAVIDACKAGKAAEANATSKELNDPFHPSFAYKTLRLFTRFALLSIKNSQARAEYIGEIASYAKGYAVALSNDAKLAAERAVAVRNSCRRAFMSRTSASNKWFDGVMKTIFEKDGPNFGSLLDYCRKQLYPEKTLKQLNESERALLFAKVVENSGRSNFTHDLIFKAEGAIGWTVIVTTLALLVYDIVDSQADFTSKVVEVLGDGAEFLGVWAGAAAAEALATTLFGEAATLTIMLFGLAGGVIAGLAIGGLIEGLKLLFEAIFNSQSHALWEQYLKRPYVYKVKLPQVDLDLDD